jgi:tRNA-2-methylthio-N6-dimethylallyladenosine synthase
MPKGFYLEKYGCQMNVYDAKRIVDLMERHGFREEFNPKDADILIFYTCNIRENAAKKVYSRLGMLRSEKTKVIAIGGCVAQAEKADIFNMSRNVNIVFGPHVYHMLPSYIQRILNGETKRIIDIEYVKDDKFGEKLDEGKVAHSEFVTIQEGCNNFCSYCVVPYTRGREYSRSVKDIIADIRHLVSNGTKAITLIGQNVNSYSGEAPYVSIGTPNTPWKLDRLLREIAGIDGIRRIRYTTSHPKDVSVELMKAHTEIPLLVPFTHIPIQSGSDRILQLMNRGHTSSEYLDKLKMFCDICPDMQFSSDFIVGFPTETFLDFEDTLKVVDEMQYTISYAFKYSRRKNTPADTMPEQVPASEKEKRLKLLQDALTKYQILRNESLLGKTQEVLFDKHGKKDGQYIGKNVYMQSVVVESNINLIGEFRDVLIKSTGTNCVFGRVL